MHADLPLGERQKRNLEILRGIAASPAGLEEYQVNSPLIMEYTRYVQLSSLFVQALLTQCSSKTGKVRPQGLEGHLGCDVVWDSRSNYGLHTAGSRSSTNHQARL